MHLLAWAVLIFWIMALGRVLLNLITMRRLAADAPDEGPLVSVIIPARNEERAIERTVRGFLNQTYRNLELIVVDDRSTDTTGAILQRLAAEDPRLCVISGIEPPAGWLGKPWALDQGSSVARGDLLLFVDADIVYSPRAVAGALDALRRERAGMIVLLPRIEMFGFWENVAMPMLGFFIFAGFPIWLANRTRLVALALGGGTGNLVTREAYERSGGFPQIKDAVIDDIAMGRLIRRSGSATRIINADDFISVRMYHGGREVVHGFTKNGFQGVGRSYLLAALMMIALIVIHLLPYALALTGSMVAIANVVLISLLRLILFRALHYRLDNALLLHPLMVIFWAYIFLRSVWITGVRNQVHWRGRVYEPSR